MDSMMKTISLLILVGCTSCSTMFNGAATIYTYKQDTTYVTQKILLVYHTDAFGVRIPLFYESIEDSLNMTVVRIDRYHYKGTQDNNPYIITFPGYRDRRTGFKLKIESADKTVIVGPVCDCLKTNQ